ncbi:hypothetical protein BV25DRAFT_1922245 [Artomyces pyxidatus]|uniref:Uncharacterized protein n=1 Tax=Artomyces pyxidatus TaxID=48021 RepID=A0ACB8SGM0_9AGAM|nr:hypothetical protein BV25DRAFT_1922245 [Artomyces pyxidatus]
MAALPSRTPAAMAPSSFSPATGSARNVQLPQLAQQKGLPDLLSVHGGQRRLYQRACAGRPHRSLLRSFLAPNDAAAPRPDPYAPLTSAPSRSQIGRSPVLSPFAHNVRSPFAAVLEVKWAVKVKVKSTTARSARRKAVRCEAGVAMTTTAIPM